MFDLIPNLLSSVASFLFPLFASYKALKTSDPSQLAPWLMYWVVLACALLAESWTFWIISWIPFYAYLRLLFLLFLVLPQMQGARILYTTHLHPFLQENEAQIEEFIAVSHERLKDAGLAYLKTAIDLIKTNVLGMPPDEPAPPPPSATNAQSYTQNLLARFAIPAPSRWTSSSTGSDFYNLLASAVSVAASSVASGNSGRGNTNGNASSSAQALIPPNLTSSTEKMSFIAAQRERLAYMLSALDREARQIQLHGDGISPTSASSSRPRSRVPSSGNTSELHDDPIDRPPSGFSGWSGISKSRSENDFEKIDVDSGPEEDSSLRRRTHTTAAASPSSPHAGSSWIPWGWGPNDTPSSTSSGADRQ